MSEKQNFKKYDRVLVKGFHERDFPLGGIIVDKAILNQETLYFVKRIKKWYKFLAFDEEKLINTKNLTPMK